MATVTLVGNGGDRLVISTICTHLLFFHEAGFQYRTERKVAVVRSWWKPATWRGFRWARSAEATQPSSLRCLFNGTDDAIAAGATAQTSRGFFRLSCEHFFVRRHCVWVAVGEEGPPGSSTDAGDVRLVRDVSLTFDYAGRRHELRHSRAPALTSVVTAR
jgi:hypothetical protein